MEISFYIHCFLVTYDAGTDELVQTDWDYPALAERFGWGGPDSSSTMTEVAQATEYLVQCAKENKRVPDDRCAGE